MMIESRNISVVDEKRIVTGMITSTDFIKEIQDIIEIDYFTNSYLKKIAQWCLAFFDEHKKAPNQHIRDIYEAESCRLKETDSELIGDLLKILDDQYDPESINVGYLADSSVEYFRKRELEIAVNNISILKDKGDLEGAEAQIDKFQKVTRKLDQGHLINLGDISQVRKIYKKREEEDKRFFKLPGYLGRYLGNYKRGDVVGYFAPAKRGKSFVLGDHFKHSILQKRKTIFWSAEMTDTEIVPRLIKTFHPMTEEEGEFPFPVFDCVRNQVGSCADRISGVIVREGDELFDDPTHKVCTKCKNGDGPHKYEMTTYTDTIFRDQDDIFSVDKFYSGSKRGISVEKMFDKYARISVHKKYTLSYAKLIKDIEKFISDGFIPDIFIIDYIDILDMGIGLEGYKAVDEAWKMMARLAGEYNTLVITVTQANKEGAKAENLNVTHQGGYYGKVQHVNMMCGIMQTPQEKAQGILRFGISEARSQPFIEGQSCTVLTDLKSGQVYLDSYF